MPEENENLMLEVLRAAYPGRRDEQILAFALIYAGILWGQDYRFGEVPRDERGVALNVCLQEGEYRSYLSWLADYLYELEGEPNEEQSGLCIWMDRMEPEDAMILLGMNAALYQTTVIMPIQQSIEDDLPFERH